VPVSSKSASAGFINNLDAITITNTEAGESSYAQPYEGGKNKKKPKHRTTSNAECEARAEGIRESSRPLSNQPGDRTRRVDFAALSTLEAQRDPSHKSSLPFLPLRSPTFVTLISNPSSSPTTPGSPQPGVRRARSEPVNDRNTQHPCRSWHGLGKCLLRFSYLPRQIPSITKVWKIRLPVMIKGPWRPLFAPEMLLGSWPHKGASASISSVLLVAVNGDGANNTLPPRQHPHFLAVFEICHARPQIAE
jgi:hypothetical protein